MAQTRRAATLDGVLGPYAALRGNRSLMLLIAANSLSALIDWQVVVALVVLAYTLTHAATTVALLTFARLLPYALMLPLAGALTDTVSRTRLMVAANLGRALCVLALLAVHSRATLPLAFPLVFAAASLSGLFRPAFLASLPSLVPERRLVQVNTVVGQIDMAAFGAGPAIAGVILALGSPRAVLVVAAAGLLLAAAAISLASLPAPAVDEPGQDPGVADLLGGVRFLAGGTERVLLGIAVAWCGLTVQGGAYWAISVVLATRAFHIGGPGLGILNGLYALGGLLGGFLVGSVMARVGLARAFMVSAAASSLAFILFGLSPAGVWPFVFYFLIGPADAVTKVVGVTVIQAATPPHLLGRVFGAFEAAFVLAMVIGSLLAGPLITVYGARAATVMVAVLGLAALLLAVPLLRRLEGTLGVRLFLQQVPVLTAVSVRLLDELAGRFRTERFAAGDVIIRQGDRGDRFYLVKRGTVEVLAEGNGRAVALATLSRRAFFGEIALLHDVPRTATVRSLSAVELYSLGRDDFQELLRRSDALDQAVRREGRARDLARHRALLLHP